MKEKEADRGEPRGEVVVVGKQGRRAVREGWDVRCFPSSSLEFIV